MNHSIIINQTFMSYIIQSLTLRNVLNTKHQCPFHLSGILPQPRFYYRTKHLDK